MEVAMTAANTGPRSAPAELQGSWVGRAKAGDRGAQRMLVRRYQRPVGAILRRMLGPAGLDHLVEDLAQETFLRALRALPRFDLDGPAKLSTWLLRIASRLAINELERRRPVTEALPTTNEVHRGPAAADEEHGRRQVAAAIQAAVGELAPQYRAAFLLREYHELDYAEIAETLELDLGTVKSRLHRARMALRQKLEEVHRGT
jgi:RNA polymerase sigma-70 factor (ECF subfamily)